MPGAVRRGKFQLVSFLGRADLLCLRIEVQCMARSAKALFLRVHPSDYSVVVGYGRRVENIGLVHRITLQEWTEASSIPSALVSMLLRLPKVKFVIVTLGKDGCIMLQRTEMDNLLPEEMDVEDLFEKLNLEKDTNATLPACISSNVAKLHAKGIGTIIGKLLVGTAESIPQTELIDTTGAGDAFIGAVLHSIYANMPPEKMLQFAAQVAAIKCRTLGARAGLPRYTDPRLSPFLV
ncbi:hypothetical protein HAX54_031090 [Datura stramonium]|uniref:Carbohydrate kinase PfkB domain-containing protein n=1 Tax=Datura stramonium TaxID=4076 RepID=A0ABS8V9C5_DATST|nr:hypothetical protein [Datura stramonium]